jgi:hypothetical protein
VYFAASASQTDLGVEAEVEGVMKQPRGVGDASETSHLLLDGVNGVGNACRVLGVVPDIKIFANPPVRSNVCRPQCGPCYP